MKNKETLVFTIIAFIVGILVGFMIGTKVGGGGPVVTAPPVQAPPVVNHQQNIRRLEELLAKEPENRNAWVQLGNTYFDSQQPMKAIEAYGKALELDGNDPNVLTDQGIMFRRMGWFDRAIANFEKAAEIDPQHAQSLYNLGVVYRYDLQDFPNAVKAWEKFLALNPSGPGAEQVRKELEFLKSHPPIPAGQPAPSAGQ
ncbi:TPR repeat protein [Geothermobacter ehrlichii]|uniref:TPR repeat protein n=1 Tax=Geothermobacter ehrlichii TaxID=213224 RepID=A0A5D3WLH7_9BACT|nr:tetratricopeptide repeat protein [Geothermobacter ehrlichii]TYO99562.1 TPR repeat protein [Geothermobacter ehrlichii]